MAAETKYAVYGRGPQKIVIELITSSRRGRAIRRFKELAKTYGRENIYLSTLTVDGQGEEEITIDG